MSKAGDTLRRAARSGKYTQIRGQLWVAEGDWNKYDVAAVVMGKGALVSGTLTACAVGILAMEDDVEVKSGQLDISTDQEHRMGEFYEMPIPLIGTIFWWNDTDGLNLEEIADNIDAWLVAAALT